MQLEQFGINFNCFFSGILDLKVPKKAKKDYGCTCTKLMLGEYH